jgi:hypothetical protein
MPKQIRYKRPTPRGVVKEQVILTPRKFNSGELIEFRYGLKQKPGQIGGWKNDPKPALLVFYDDGHNYIEGVNTHYLSEYYLKKVIILPKIFPGIEGTEIYDVIKRTAPKVLAKGYRKYIRTSLKSIFRYVPKGE